MKKTNFTFLKGLAASALMTLGVANTNAQGLACQDFVNASLDATCTVSLASLKVAANADAVVIKDGNLTLTTNVADVYGTASTNGGIVIGKTYTYELTKGAGASMIKCWGNIKFEDKLAPAILCPLPVAVACNATYGFSSSEVEIVANSVTPKTGQITQAQYLALNNLLLLPQITECSSYRLFYSDSKTLACTPTTVGTVTRNFRVTDVYGNTTSCAQTITINAPVLPLATPANVTVTDCGVTAANYTASKYEPADVVNGVTIPNINSPAGDCMLNSTYTDKVAFDACGAKIVRTWVVVNMCTGQVLPLTATAPQSPNVQVITITDNEAPKFSAPAVDITATPATNDYNIPTTLVITTGAASCLSAQQVPFPASTDNCRIATRTLNVGGVNYTADANGAVIIGLPIGTYPAIWTVVDACGNRATATQNIEVKDLIPPVAVADQNTNVSLTLDCTATVNASSFDDGSLDNCCLDVNRFEVKRMTELTDAKYADLKGNKSYSDQITFVKEDLAGGCSNTLQVLFRVWDCYGNSNIAMVNVKVEDKIGPVAAGKDTTVMCGNTALGTQWLESWEARFKALNTLQYPPVAGTNPGYFDNCDAIVTWGTVGGSINQCSNGSMTRTATIKDKCDRSTTANFVYNSGHQAEFEVTLPANATYTCPGSSVPSKADAIAAARATLKTIAGCPVVAIDIKSEETFSAVNGACYRIKRTWVVTSLCHNGMMRGDKGLSDSPVMGTGAAYVYKSNLDGTDPTGKTNPNDDKYVEYVQVIDVNDTEKPTISNPQTPALLAEGKCGLKLTIGGFDATDACAPVVVKSWTLLDANKATVTGTTANPTTGTSFPATYTFTTADFGKKFYVRYRAEDKCGNIDVKDYLVEPKDIIKPTPLCYQGLSVDLMPTTGEVWLSATNFDAGSSDGCQVDASTVAIAPAVANPAPANNARQYSADKSVELRLERGVVDAAGNVSWGAGLPTTNMIWVGCVGIVPIRLWAVDAAGNADYCETYVDVQNNMGATPKEGGNCNSVKPTGSRIAGTVKAANGSAIENATVTVKAATLANGHIASNVSNGQFNVLVGTTTSATVAADKNDEPLNGVSTYDLVLISKHILGTQNISDKYALIAADVNNNGKVAISDVVELRKMILGLQSNFNNNKSWRFFDATMNEEVALNNINGVATVNFTGVKIGDINGNANAASAQRTAGTHEFVVADRNIAAGEEVTVTLNGTEGFGFTMNYDANALQVVSVDENSAVIENGTITTAQVGSEFKVTFKATAATTLSNAIAINSNITAAEAVVNGELYNATLKFNNKVNGFALLQNQPNPFRGATMISFNAPAAGDYTITITDIAGRTVKAMNGNAVKGLNNVNVEMNNAGVYNYTVTTGNFTATKKMVVME